jgi:hypothetical protein
MLVDYVKSGQRVAGQPAHTVLYPGPHEGSQRCELEVLSVEQVC